MNPIALTASAAILLLLSPFAAAFAQGPIVAWGGNEYGQCTVPAPNADFVAVAGGVEHSLGLKANGTIVAWGSNGAGQCNVPAPNADFVAVAAGYWHSLGLKANGTIVAWGYNPHGQCNVPAPNADFVAVAGAEAHSLGLKADGSIVAWGDNESGQCDVPAPNAGFVTVAGNDYQSLGVKADGSIVAWGDNYFGQCNVPAPNTGFVAVAGGPYHSLGLKADGSIVAWGDNSWGQCDVPVPNRGFMALAVEGGYSLAIKDVLAPVGISALEALPRPEGILLRWITTFESDHAGFHVHRAMAESSDFVRLTTSLITLPGPYRFVDADVTPGTTYRYRLEAVDRSGGSEFFGPVEATAVAGTGSPRFALSQNQPNPFVAERGGTVIGFALAERSEARLRIFDAAGRLVRLLVDEPLEAGAHTAWWDGRTDGGQDAGLGIYYYRLDAGALSESRALVKLR